MKKKLSEKIGKIASKENKEKAKKAVKETGGFIAENKKELLYAGGAIIAGIIVYKIFRATSKGISDVFSDKVQTVDLDVKVNNSNTTITREQSQQFARTILDACNHAAPFYGTDEEAIKEVFLKIKTADDFKLVYNAFGMKDYNGNNSPPSGILRHLDSYAPRDLVYWLRSELTPSDGEVYTIVKKRIESAGYAF